MKTATKNGHFPKSAREAATLYLGFALAPIPLPYRSKDPGFKGWPQFRFTQDSLDRDWPEGQKRGIGVLNGEPSGNTADVDLDCPEALRAAPFLLPRTGWRFGRESTPRSHWIYRTDSPFDKEKAQYLDPIDQKCLIELRGTGGHTVFPPSHHADTGEELQWDTFTTPADVRLADLQTAVVEVAVVALLVRHWPAHGWHHMTLPLVGGLLRGGLAVERVEKIIEALWKTAGTRDKPSDRDGAVRTTAEKLAAGENVVGWPRLAENLGEHGDRIVSQVRNWLGLSTMAEAANLPLPSETPWPDALAPEAFHGMAGDLVRAIEPSSEADPAALLFQTIVGFGNMIGRTAHFRVEATQHFANEFVTLVGRTSKGRKGTSWSQINRTLRSAEEEWATERIQSGLSSGEGAIWAVRDPVKKMERVKERGEAPRYEEVEVDAGVRDKRLLIVEPEFASVLKHIERQGNTLSATLRQAWESGDLRTMVKNSPARATGAHISLIGHCTAEELRRYLSTTEMASGFGNRIMWVAVKRSKSLPEGGLPDARALDDVQVRLGQAMAFAKRQGEMKRDDGAREIWRAVYDELSGDRPGLGGAMLGRAEAHTMRLAMIYALLDQSPDIQADHMLAALALWDYASQSVRYVFGDSLGDPVADDLLRLLRSNPEGLTRTEIMGYFGRNQSTDRIGRALGLLQQFKLAEGRKSPSGGRPVERWFALKQEPKRDRS